MPSKKKTATCSTCGKEKHGRFVGGMCNACYLKSLKKTATCTGCGEEKHCKFVVGMCKACYTNSRKETAVCECCGESKHSLFTKGMCNACYLKSQKKTATCEVCGKEKQGRFARGVCQACYKYSKKKTATCEVCGEEKHNFFTNGLCHVCYSNSQKKKATCEGCGEEKHDVFTKGLCNACYHKTPRKMKKRNERERRRLSEDEGYRIARRIANGLRSSLSGRKSKSTLELIDCTHEGLLAHFEATMHEGCGESPHIGHILVPKSWAIKYAGDEGVALCFQLANLAYQNPVENLRLQDNPWYDCPFITDETIAVARKFLDIAGTGEPELAELSAFIEVYESAAV